MAAWRERWFPVIATRAGAKVAVARASDWAFCLAGVHFFGVFVEDERREALLGVAMICALALWLRLGRSRLAATLLLILGVCGMELSVSQGARGSSSTPLCSGSARGPSRRRLAKSHSPIAGVTRRAAYAPPAL